jgi:hypothetical protein
LKNIGKENHLLWELWRKIQIRSSCRSPIGTLRATLSGSCGIRQGYLSRYTSKARSHPQSGLSLMPFFAFFCLLEKMMARMGDIEECRPSKGRWNNREYAHSFGNSAGHADWWVHGSPGGTVIACQGNNW